MIKTPSKLGTEGNFLNPIKGTYEKATANIIPNSECFLPKIENKTGMSVLTISIHHCTGGSGQCDETRKNKSIQIEKEVNMGLPWWRSG